LSTGQIGRDLPWIRHPRSRRGNATIEEVRSSRLSTASAAYRRARMRSREAIRRASVAARIDRDLEGDAEAGVADGLSSAPRFRRPRSFKPLREERRAHDSGGRCASADREDPLDLAAWDRIRRGLEPIAPDPQAHHRWNFLYMRTGEQAIPESRSRLLNMYLVLLATTSFICVDVLGARDRGATKCRYLRRDDRAAWRRSPATARRRTEPSPAIISSRSASPRTPSVSCAS